MADNGNQQRKPDFRTAVENAKALATVLVMKLESVLGRRMYLRNPAVLAAIGVVATLVLALVVVMALLQTGGAKAVSDNAGLIGALVALGGVFTAQMVSIALEDQRTQDDAVQAYYKEMGALLTEHKLTDTKERDPIRLLAQAQTMSLLERLDAASNRARRNKGVLILFLYDAGLINEDNTIMDLHNAYLRNADLNRAYLRNAHLRNTYLSGADLSGAKLGDANLSRTVLSHANLSRAELSHTNLSGSHLTGADLTNVDLTNADLTNANLSGAAGITNEELVQQTTFLEGATMPSGQKYEDWLKNRGEENSGSS